MNRNGIYGINMKYWCREHEKDVKDAIDKDSVTAVLVEDHLRKIAWLQHERLVHLIVTVMVVFAELFVVYLVLLHPELGFVPAAIMLAFAVLLGFYFYHYFFLENTVQRWYVIADKMTKERMTENIEK